MKRILRHLTLSPLLLLSIATLTACGGDTEESASSGRPSGGWGGARELPVVTAPIVFNELRENIKSVGTARAKQSVTLFPESNGTVTFARLAPDSFVAEGETLLKLDDRDERLALQQAEVELAEEERTLKRYRSLNATDANIPPSTIDTAAATVELAKIRVESAKVELSRREVKAPFSGRIGITDVEIGDRVNTSTVVTTLDDRSTLLVDFTVPETFIGRVVPELIVQARQWESPDSSVMGTVIAVDSRVDASTRAFRARAAIDNTADNLRPGMAFEIDASLSLGDYLSVPELSVQWGADGPYVWSADDSVATRTPVEMVRRVDGRMLIKGDIAEGQRVVLEGIQSVRSGMRLKDVNDPRNLAKPGASSSEPRRGGVSSQSP